MSYTIKDLEVPIDNKYVLLLLQSLEKNYKMCTKYK